MNWPHKSRVEIKNTLLFFVFYKIISIMINIIYMIITFNNMLLDWKKIAEEIYTSLKNNVIKTKNNITLWAILVWDNPASIRYIKQKKKWADYIWINFVLKRVDINITEAELISLINDFNRSSKITWFIVQLPLPKHINENNIIATIEPLKDVDGFHPINQWKLLIWDKSWFLPCTPAGIMEFFKKENIKFSWKHVVVIWRSNIVWKPITNLLINSWATVTTCNSKTPDLKRFTSFADIIIVAAWKPWLLKAWMVKHWSIIIDVGFTIIDWKIYWDADTKNIDLMWSKITPVPWWVWALTVAMLMTNVLKAWGVN